MYALLLVALVIGAVAAAFGVSHVMTSGSTSTLFGRLGVAAGLVAVALVALLLFAQPLMCDLLGGAWNDRIDQCESEFGADPSSD
jgi:hypothetical protein